MNYQVMMKDDDINDESKVAMICYAYQYLLIILLLLNCNLLLLFVGFKNI